MGNSKSTDMINWEKCEEDIPVSNSRKHSW